MNAMYRFFNPNPHKSRVGDCTIRAICKATGKPWDEVYVSLCAFGFNSKDMPSANAVWGDYLYSLGFRRYLVEEMHYTVADFAHDHPEGVYILALDSHVVCVADGCYFDTWDSGDEIPIFYWKKG